MNTIEAAALQAIRAYYRPHNGAIPLAGVKPCVCSACRKARTFASLIGVDLDKEE